MSKEWKNGRVGELIASLESGISVNGEDGTPSNDDYAVLKVSAVTYGKFNPQASKKITGSELQRAKCNPKKGQIIISRSNTPDLVGASCYVSEDYPNRFLPDKLWQTVPHPEKKVEHKWLAYFLASPWARFRLSKLATGTSNSMKNITKSELLTLPVAIPPFLEQKKIASFLECWDNAIEKTEALIAAKEKQFEWLCTNLLSGRKKSFGFTGKSIPTAFGSIFSLFKKVNTSCADYEVLSVTKDGIVSQSEYFNKEVASKDKSKYLIVDKDTLVMSGLNFWMGAIDFQTIRDTGIVSPAYKTFKVNEGPYNRDYLRFFIRSHYMTKILLDSSIQGASIVRRNLDMEWLSNSLIDLPNLEEQIDIANILSLAEKEIDGLKLLAEKYRSQKRGLMQKLLTGEWQVSSSLPVAEDMYQEASA
ncbi:restriction endonuclease subunit S [Providencia vermicola]|uniref:restriction endonuclease subunit S n=1 Tax=Providencia vermicola TaxID=333965 RepID=UPI0034E3E058|nr:restriction endonuclease subunit S [Vibrio parahaemolyticus]